MQSGEGDESGSDAGSGREDEGESGGEGGGGEGESGEEYGANQDSEDADRKYEDDMES